jgi:hypothetical protein
MASGAIVVAVLSAMAVVGVSTASAAASASDAYSGPALALLFFFFFFVVDVCSLYRMPTLASVGIRLVIRWGGDRRRARACVSLLPSRWLPPGAATTKTTTTTATKRGIWCVGAATQTFLSAGRDPSDGRCGCWRWICIRD